MRRKAAFLAVLLCVWLSACVTLPPAVETEKEPEREIISLDLPSYTGRKRVIYVFDLYNKSDFDDPRIGRGVAQMLITALVNSNRFRVVERRPEVIRSILDEQKLSLSGIIDAQTAARVGKMLGAEAVVVGEVSEFGIRKTGIYTGLTGARNITTRIVIDARMVDVETAEIVTAATGIGTSTTQARGAGAILSFEYGTEGFDETSIGIATRVAVNLVVRKFSLWVSPE